MSTHRNRDPAWIGVLDRVYGVALWLYPPAHRRRFGAQMRQAFRDRCREAARAGRGPWSVLLGELLPDLALSAGRERFDTFTGFPPMKRALLMALLLAAVGSMVFHARLGDAAVALKDRWDQYQQQLDWRAMKAHEADLAAAVERRGDAHADVVAAQLYFAAADGFRRRYPEASKLSLSVDETNRSDALLDHADAAFARALTAGDTWALWLAATNCPARASVCAAEASYARLRQVDAGNGAVWLLDLDRAKPADDPARERVALANMAHATAFDWHLSDSMRGMLAAFDLRALPSRLRETYADGSRASAQDSASLLAANVGSANAVVSMPGAQPLFDLCKSNDPSILVDCRAAARLMAEHGTGAIDRMTGLALWRRVADASESARVQAMYRNAQWRQEQWSQVVPEVSAMALTRWRTAWATADGETQVFDTLLRQQGIALQAPADFVPRHP